MTRHPHPDRLAEIYRKVDGRLTFIGYTAEPPPGATWDADLQGWIIDSTRTE
jgi:hypothetical protein